MSGAEILRKRAADEIDLAIGRFIGGVVATVSGVTILCLGRTTVSFVAGVITLLAGIGWIFAVRRAARAVRAGVVHTLTIDEEALELVTDKTVRVPWRSVESVDIDDESGAIVITSANARVSVEAGFGGHGVVPLYEKLQARWRATRGDALR